MKPTLLLPAIVLVAACAQNPDNIAAANIGSNEYRGHSCKNLAEAKVQHNQNLANLSADQKKAATGDAVGVFLLGLPLSSMSGGDKETAIAVTKGHLQSIEGEQARKNCR
jgi:hypothetical protein